MARKRLPAEYHITVYRGDGFYMPVRLYYRDSSGDQQLIDTDGWTARMGVKTDKEASTYLLHSDSGHMTLTTGVSGTGASAKNLEVFIPKNRTASLPAGLIGVYDIELTDNSGRPLTYLAGQFCVEGDVS